MSEPHLGGSIDQAHRRHRGDDARMMVSPISIIRGRSMRMSISTSFAAWL